AEKAHLEAIERVLPLHRRSKLLPCWRAAGWLIGALPSLFGAVAVYNTIDAVESFVDKHYQEQIDYLEHTSQCEALLTLLKTCQADEISHRNEARHLASGPRTRVELVVTAVWTWVVGAGSKAAVSIARVI
ncbi:MAG: demethoxyubiquinone hydroxylase family protein, partial [Pseudomonadota bacterium]